METLLAGYGKHQERRDFITYESCDGVRWYLIQDKVDEDFYENSVGEVPKREGFGFPYWLDTYVEDAGCHTYYHHRVLTEKDLSVLGLQMAWAIHEPPQEVNPRVD